MLQHRRPANTMSTISIVYAANRKIGLTCLQELLAAGITPLALLLAEGEGASFHDEMHSLLPATPTFSGKTFRSKEGLALLSTLKPDYLISVHFPYIIPPEILALPRIGALNSHPAFLPFNKGWNTPMWAIVEQTPYGATLHWIDEGIDTGDIALQEQIDVPPTITAHALYQRALAAEQRIFHKALPLLKQGALPHIPQIGEGTSHAKGDIRRIQNLDACMDPVMAERIVRGLTTNNLQESAYRTIYGERCCVRMDEPLLKFPPH